MLEKLSSKDRDFIKNQVTCGYYASEIEVVRDAVRRLREKVQDEKLVHLRALALKGHEELLRGEGEVYSRAMMDGLLEQAKKDNKNGKRIKDEVKG
jgi:putative addiction module CopG family antidote